MEIIIFIIYAIGAIIAMSRYIEKGGLWMLFAPFLIIAMIFSLGSWITVIYQCITDDYLTN